MNQFIKLSFTNTIIIVASIVILSYSACSTRAEAKEIHVQSNEMVSEAAVELKCNMRKLWEDHISWTRNVILCLVDGLPGTEQAIARQLLNQDHLGNSIKPYYGEKSGEKLTELLYAHINISLEVVKAAKIGDKLRVIEAKKRWYSNGNAISEFLCNENPSWELTQMKMMMRHHLDLTANEVDQRLKKDYEGDVIAYAKVHDGILEMADMLSDGIILQFPYLFEARCMDLIVSKK